MFEKLSDFIMGHAKLIIAIWIALLVCAIPLALQSGSALQYDMAKMQSKTSESSMGNDILASTQFNQSGGSSASTILVVEVLDGSGTVAALTTCNLLQKSLTAEFEKWEVNKKLIRDYPEYKYQVTIDFLSIFDDKYFKDLETDMGIFSVSFPVSEDGEKIVKASTCVSDIRDMVKRAVQTVRDGGNNDIVATYVTGSDPISYDTMTGATADIKKIDPISILLIFILIGLFFRSVVSATTPPVIIGVAYAIVLCLMFLIGQAVGIYYITSILVLVSMLGAGCDYCIFIISRYREERKKGLVHEDALRQSIIWAGESILTSGCSVIIGFGVMSFCSFSLVSTMGMVLALGIILALLAALTFIPSILMIVGEKIFWPSNVGTYADDSKAMKGWYGKIGRIGANYFIKSANTSIKYAKVIVIAAVLITAPLAYVAVTSHPSYDMINTMPDGEAKQGVNVISTNIGGGTIMPTFVLMDVKSFVNVNQHPNSTHPDSFRVTLEDTVGLKVMGSVFLEDYFIAVDKGYTEMPLIIEACDKTGDTWYYFETWATVSGYEVTGTSDDGDNRVTVSVSAQKEITEKYNAWQTDEKMKFNGDIWSLVLDCIVSADGKERSSLTNTYGTIANPESINIFMRDTKGTHLRGTMFMSDYDSRGGDVPIMVDVLGSSSLNYYSVEVMLDKSTVTVTDESNDYRTVKFTEAAERKIIDGYNSWQRVEADRFGTADSVSMDLYAVDGTARQVILTSVISAEFLNTDDWTYKELENATASYTGFDDFSSSLMKIQTDGEYNIAMAIGPVSGDILFDGTHGALFDMLMKILPQDVKDMISELFGKTAYQDLCTVWKILPRETQTMINYELTYKSGFVSASDKDDNHQYVKFIVLTKEEPMADISMETVQQVMTEKDRFFETHYEVKGAYVTGAAVMNYEISEIVTEDFNVIMIVVILLLLALLFFVMKSYLTPIRAVATIVMSILWTLGLTFIIFDHLLGMPVVWIVPIVLFVICLGLGMDYDILLTTRIKENVSKGMSNDDAIKDAVHRSGAVITICGLIMGGAFGTMMMSSSPMLQEFGFALGFAILVDALVIRTYVVPAMMHLMGDWNWKGPSFLHRKEKKNLEQ